MHSGEQVIRRRYGTVSQQCGSKLKYHEYNLVDHDPASGKLTDSKGCTLFHLLPELGDRGEGGRRGSGGSTAKRSYAEISPASADRSGTKAQRTSSGGRGASSLTGGEDSPSSADGQIGGTGQGKANGGPAGGDCSDEDVPRESCVLAALRLAALSLSLSG